MINAFYCYRVLQRGCDFQQRQGAGPHPGQEGGLPPADGGAHARPQGPAPRCEEHPGQNNSVDGKLYLALEYGCLENELLDGLMDHHNCGNVKDLKVGKSWEKKYASR